MLNLLLEEIEQRQAVLDEVSEERTFQDSKWGGPDHDDQHTEADWLRFIEDRVEYQRFALRFPERYAQENNPYANNYRACLVKIAALTVAGIQSLDRRNVSSARLQQIADAVIPEIESFDENDMKTTEVENNGLRWTDTFSGS